MMSTLPLNQILPGDCLEVLPGLPGNSVDLVFADNPIVRAALAQWSSKQTRLVIGGWGSSPSVAMDGNEASAVETAAHNVAYDAKDEWASAEYRSEVAAVLAKRCLENS